MSKKQAKPDGQGRGPGPGEPDDAELARRTASGDRQAAGMLIGRYQAPVRGFLLRMCGRADLADDLAQETFLRLLHHADRYDPQYKMITWLLTIARRLWLNKLRQADRQMDGIDMGAMTSRRMDPAETVALEDQARRTREVLDRAVAQLTETQRTAVLLFHNQELSISEIAQVMRMPEGTVKSHLHRGRTALRKILGPQLEATEP
ncbi:MAG: RNA polymerase sigma factor [Phycisphaeraceae bacterium]|nr:RNA polymerase sigma factor [Phycisphaeraceae bacterium]